jgi:hypothetical protein
MQGTTHPRLAEDGAAQLVEAVNFLEASDRIACAALVHRTDPIEALEAVVILQGRVRSFLDRVIVRAA